MAHSTRNEPALGLKVLENELPIPFMRKATKENTLVDLAKLLQRYQTKASRLRRELKHANNEVKRVRGVMRHLMSEMGRGKA